MDELRRRLREAAQRHEPDRARMLARIERGTAGDADGAREDGGPGRPLPSSAPWLRVIGATAAASGVLFAGGLVVGAAVRDEGAGRTAAASPEPETSRTRGPVPSESPAADPRGGEATRGSGAAPTRGAGSTGTAAAPGPGGTRGGADAPGGSGDGGGGGTAVPWRDGLWADGSVDPHSNEFWTQSNVTLKSQVPLTSLTVELRIARTEGVESTGSWQSLPETDFAPSVEEEDGTLLYRWTLREGRTVPPGEYVFAGQYKHAQGGRETGDDSYLVRGGGPGGPVEWRGDFAPARR
ncbi:hypothetical protein [Streptomyces sp. GC420]|uniref:hypothetical protein n=1 Tax=Streptomyces sp. GC420 TaxID=2697568 RepID=UPI001FB83C26|nr:hypothetical protein [Streptomyces sp. GC420]